MQLAGLLCLRRRHQRTGHTERRTHVLLCDLRKVFNLLRLKHNLKPRKAAAVVQINKLKRFGIPNALDPAADGNCFFCVFLRIGKNFRNFDSFHSIHTS